MLKMLIAEDDLTSCVILQGILAHYGTAHIATNGKIAVELFRKALDEDAPFDLICLDIMMPQMDGMEALISIRSLEKSLALPGRSRIIMTTVLDKEEIINNAYANGCDAYITKPVVKKNLIQKLDEFGLFSQKRKLNQTQSIG